MKTLFVKKYKDIYEKIVDPAIPALEYSALLKT
jgi:hypothetical protein